MRIYCSAFLFGLSFFASQLQAQLPTGWRAHDLKRPAPPVIDPGKSNLPANVPSDAIVLFDGSDLSKWADDKGGPAKWKVVDGAMESVPGSGYVFTKEHFGDCQLHIEWAAPVKVQGNGQGRGNSGVFLMGKYELQVLDSYDNPTYADGSAGSIYGQYPPLVNACRKPGEWQSYDIVFHGPRFDESGKLKSPARMTVLHNGVLIQDNSKIFGPTAWIMLNEYQAGPDKQPLSLQDHGNPVRYRNIWIRQLSERAKPDQPYASETADVKLDAGDQEKLVGNYDKFSVENLEGQLVLVHLDRKLEMLPVSKTKFEFRKSAGTIEFNLDSSGKVESANLILDAAGSTLGKKK